MPIAHVPYTTGNLGPAKVIGTDDILTVANDISGYSVGDAGGQMLGGARGGNDTITGQLNSTSSHYIGDCQDNMHDKAAGGSDTITGAANTHADNVVLNVIFGDTNGFMFDKSVGGDDSLTGGAGARDGNILIGDAEMMTDNSRGGDDQLTGAAKSNGLILTGGNSLVGDAENAFGHAKGGADFLNSGTGDDAMSGDFLFMSGFARGGNDRFTFGAANGHDTIVDFGQGGNSSIDGFNHGKDVIDITWGPTSFSQLTISAFNAGTHTSVISGSVAGSDITVHSDHALSSHDFIFV